MSDAKAKQALMLSGCGGLVLALSFVTAVIIGLLPMLTDGRASPDEAYPALGGPCCCSLMGLIAVIVGLVLYQKAKQAQQAAAQNE